MKGRRHTPEQVVRKLREADRLLAEGKTSQGGIWFGIRGARRSRGRSTSRPSRSDRTPKTDPLSVRVPGLL